MPDFNAFWLNNATNVSFAHSIIQLDHCVAPHKHQMGVAARRTDRPRQLLIVEARLTAEDANGVLADLSIAERPPPHFKAQ
jgi:hypothetical protein